MDKTETMAQRAISARQNRQNVFLEGKRQILKATAGFEFDITIAEDKTKIRITRNGLDDVMHYKFSREGQDNYSFKISNATDMGDARMVDTFILLLAGGLIKDLLAYFNISCRRIRAITDDLIILDEGKPFNSFRAEMLYYGKAKPTVQGPA